MRKLVIYIYIYMVLLCPICPMDEPPSLTLINTLIIFNVHIAETPLNFSYMV